MRGIAVPRDPAVDHLETDELALYALRLLALERVAAQKVPLLHFDDPAEVRLPRRDGVVDVVSVKRHPRLQPQRVAGAQPAGRCPVAAPLIQQSAEDPFRVLGREIQLEAVLAR